MLSFLDTGHTIPRALYSITAPVGAGFSGSAMSETFEDVTNLALRLEELRAEHRDLDVAISQLSDTPPEDELLIRRLKKRKLMLKDRIALIERMLEPDEPA